MQIDWCNRESRGPRIALKNRFCSSEQGPLRWDGVGEGCVRTGGAGRPRGEVGGMGSVREWTEVAVRGAAEKPGSWRRCLI